MIELPRTCPRHFAGVGRFCVVRVVDGAVVAVFVRSALSSIIAARVYAEVNVRYPVQRFGLHDAQDFIRKNVLGGCAVALI